MTYWEIAFLSVGIVTSIVFILLNLRDIYKSRKAKKETPCLDGTTDSAKTTTVNSDAGLQKDLAQGNNLGDKA